MKKITRALIGALASFCLFGCATMNRADPEKLRLAFHAMNAVDVGTTIARDPTCMSETNPFLGTNPTDGEVIAYAALQSLLYEGVYYYLQRTHPEQIPPMQWMFLFVKSIGPIVNVNTLSRGCN